MKKYILLLILALTTSHASLSQNPYADFIRQLDTLKKTKLKMTPIVREWQQTDNQDPEKDYYIPQEAIAEYVACFDRLRLTLPDATVQCYYSYSRKGGQPYLVASPVSIDSLLNIGDISIRSVRDYAAEKFMVPAEDTPMAYFQYLIFKEYGNQFALYWHALYGVKDILLQLPGKKEGKKSISLSSLLTITDEALYEKSKSEGILPSVTMDDTHCHVTLFESNHENVRKVHYRINRSEPWQITVVEEHVMAKKPAILY